MINGVIRSALTPNDKLRNGDQFITPLQQTFDDTGQRLGGVKGRIMEQNDAAGMHFTHHSLGNFRRRQVLPIQAVTTIQTVQTLQHKGFILSGNPKIQGSPEYD